MNFTIKQYSMGYLIQNEHFVFTWL
jgi:hypothetical protein